MKKINKYGLILFLVIMPIFMLTNIACGQDQTARSKIEAARIALITERLGLTPEQAEKFWPVYNEYAERRRELTQELQSVKQSVNMNNLNEEQSRQIMQKSMNIRERQLALEKQYSKRLTEVISNQQFVALKNAEDDFRRMILQRLEERRRQQIQRQEMRERREEIMKNRGNN